MLKKYKPTFMTITAIVALALLILVVYSNFIDKINQEVYFKDPAFEHSIKSALKIKGPVYKKDLKKIQKLIILSNEVNIINQTVDLKITDTGCVYEKADINSYGFITSLDDLIHLPNVKEVTIVNNDIVSIPPFLNNKIVYLNLSHNSIIDIDNIKDYENLKTLNLSYNMLMDINDVSFYKNIENLNLQANAISDAKSLETSINLHTLNISCNNLQNIDFLSDMTKIKNLDISKNEIVCIMALKNLTYIENLDISFNRIETLEELSCGSTLLKLNGMNNNIITLNVAFDKLKDVNLAHNSMSGIIDLSYIKQGENIIFDFNNISSLVNLPYSTCKTLSISHNVLKDLNFINKKTAIIKLDISGNEINNISNVSKHCNNLVELNISDTAVTQVETLKDLKHFNVLIAFGTSVDINVFNPDKITVVK